MNITNEKKKVDILINQKNFQQALKLLNNLISVDSQDAELHADKSICLNKLDHDKEAMEAANTAIHLDPEWYYGYYVKCLAELKIDEIDSALASINHSISLFSEHPNLYALRGEIFKLKNHFEKAEEDADRGLEIEGDNAECLNLKASILSITKEGDKAEEMAKIAIANDPENANSINVLGWHKVRVGEYEEARKLFCESLRINPNSNTAKSGLLMVIQAQSWVFRPIVTFKLWCDKYSGKALFTFFILLWFGQRILRNLAEKNPNLEVIAKPLLIMYLVFVLFTWFYEHVFNLIIRFHPLGPVLLTKSDRMASTVFGSLALVSLGCFISYTLLQIETLIWLTAIIGMLTFTLPSALAVEIRRKKKVFIVFNVILCLLALLAITSKLFFDPLIGRTVIGLFIVGFVLYQVTFLFLQLKN